MDVLSIVDVLVLGLVAFWLWYVVAKLSPPFLMWALRPLRRRPKVRSFLMCPWCSGAWWTLAVVGAFALLASSMGIMTGAEAALWVPFTWLGGSAIVALIGTLIPDDGAPADDDD